MSVVMRRPLYLYLIAALAAAACDVKVGEDGVSVGVTGGKATDTWTRTYTVEPNGRLEIVNVNGAIDVSAATGSQVEVQIDRDARAGSDEAAREALQTVQIVEDSGGGIVKIETRTERFEGFRRRQVSSRYQVRMPPGLTASFRTENGAVTLQNLQGLITATTTNGAITGTRLSGAVTASTVNGAVQLELIAVNQAMDLTVVNGGIRLELAPDVKADIVASAVNGGVTVDEKLNLSAEGGGTRGFPPSNRVTGRLNGGGPKISAQTTNGGVRIMVQRRSSQTGPER